MHGEPVIERRDEDGILVEISWHLSIWQVLLPEFILILCVGNRWAPTLSRAFFVHVNCHQNVLAFLTNPACIMMGVDDAFSAQNSTPVRLDAFLALFYLLLGH